MNQEEQRFFEQQQKELLIAQQQANKGTIQDDLMASEMRDKDRTYMYDQLDLSEELELIENLLRSKILKREDGNSKWVSPKDKNMIILSEYGVHLCMNTISFYLNKNTLLSNYNEELINSKMRDFSLALADDIFMEYEKVFKYPTETECQERFLQTINKKLEQRRLNAEILGTEVDLVLERKKILEDYNPEKERDKIREQLMKEKLKRFEIILRCIQDSVHSTYLRALFGAERRTLRQHIHVNENPTESSTPSTQVNTKSFFGRR